MADQRQQQQRRDERPPELPDDYRLLADSPNYIVAASIPPDRDLTLRIERVTSGEVIGEGGRKSTKGLVYFEGAAKPMILNATRGKVIKRLYGSNPREWIGRWLALYRGRAKGEGGDQVPAVAVRQRNPEPAPLTTEQQAFVAELVARVAAAPDVDVLEAVLKPHRDAIAGMGDRAIGAVAGAKNRRIEELTAEAAAKEGTKTNG